MLWFSRNHRDVYLYDCYMKRKLLHIAFLEQSDPLYSGWVVTQTDSEGTRPHEIFISSHNPSRTYDNPVWLIIFNKVFGKSLNIPPLQLTRLALQQMVLTPKAQILLAVFISPKLSYLCHGQVEAIHMNLEILSNHNPMCVTFFLKTVLVSDMVKCEKPWFCADARQEYDKTPFFILINDIPKWTNGHFASLITHGNKNGVF